jgi:L-iditol 2-dehydrogenase
MKIVAITGPRQCALIEKPTPHAHENIVVVKIHVAPLCTECKGYEAGRLTECLGHEAAGEVVEVAQPGRVKVGDRVVVMPQTPCGECALCGAGDYIHCERNQDVLQISGNTAGTATYAQYLIKRDWLLLPIPGDMSYDHAAMACCGLGPTFGAMEKMRVDALDTMLISGLGAVGLGGVINARVRGARVIGVDSHPYRANLAKELGAEEVLDPRDENAAARVRELTDGRGADKAIETSGVAAAKPFLLDAVRRRGEIALVGWSGELDANRIIQKGLTIHGAWHWNLTDAPRMMQTIKQAAPLIDQFITHRFAMEQVREAWEVQLTGECGKVLLYPHQ